MIVKKPLLKRGIIAYYDTTFSGLIKVRVVSVESTTDVKVRVLANQPTYLEGTILVLQSMYVVPCAAIKRRKNKTTILPFNIRFDSDEVRD